MAPIQIKQFLFVGALCAGSAFLTTACVDNSYDLSEDLDLTMGLGSNGLSVPMGNVEKIYLNDILSVDESVKLDAANQYYLVEDGTTNFDFTIDNVTTKVDNPTLRTDPGKPALPFNTVCEILHAAGVSSIPVPADKIFSGEAEGTESMDFSVSDISSDIKAIHSVSFTPLKVSLSLEWFKSNAALKFDLKELKDVEITLPSILHVVDGSVSEGWTLTEGNKLVAHSVAFNGANMKEIVSFMIDQTQLKDCSTIENGELSRELSISPEVLQIKMKGGADFESTGSFTMTSNDYMDVRLHIKVGTPGANNKTNVYVTRAKGVFDPLINPDVESIDIASELPDFLQDPEVRVNVSNPTLKFNVYPKNNVQIPADVDFYATLHSIKDGQDQVSPVEFPKYTRLYKNTSNVIYFHQDAAPYDPTGLETDAPGKKVQTKKVDNISSLINVLPDRIEVDLGANGADKHIRVAQEENEVVLGQQYNQTVDYTIYVPFEFKNGVTIVYTDETDGMNEDLKDYAADGIQISAEAENTIPLDLKATISAYDMNGNLIPGIQFDEVDVKAGGGTDATAVTTALTIKATLTDPNLLKKLDKLEFKINAASEATSNATHKLVSTQYVQLKNVKLKLVGQIVADFNDN